MVSATQTDLNTASSLIGNSSFAAVGGFLIHPRKGIPKFLTPHS